jgi:hypothetical protein
VSYYANEQLKYARGSWIAVREGSEKTLAPDRGLRVQSGGPELLVSPNPSSRGVSISCRMPGDGPSVLALFDIGGRKIRTLALPPSSEKMRSIVWDGREDSGRAVAPGTYFLRLTSGSGAEVTERVTIVR